MLITDRCKSPFFFFKSPSRMGCCQVLVLPGWVLGAFFYGYLFTQIPGGWLATKFGGRWVYGIGIVMTALLTLLTPLAAHTNVYLLMAVRAAEGFFEVRG